MLLLKLSVLALCPLTWAVSAAGSLLVGVAYTGGTPFGPLYRIDPITGAATPLGTSAYPFELTGGPQPGQAIMMSAINPYIVNVFSGEVIYPGSYTSPVGFPAYDKDRQKMWGVSGHDNDTLWRFASPTSCDPPCFRVGTQVGPLGIPDQSLVIDYAPGLGLLGIESFVPSTLYSINRDTGLATPLESIFGLPSAFPNVGVQDFAFDEATGNLIVAVAPSFNRCCPPFPRPDGPHGIYSVDLTTGIATLLTDQGPEIVGIASVDIPEPCTLVLVVLGLVLVRGNGRLPFSKGFE